LTETRARYDRVYAIHASCKSPDACVAMWRRNARFTLPFMLFGKHTGTSIAGVVTTPQYMDDECRIYTGDADSQKFETHRSQWESVCRHCCVAEDTPHCNVAANTPLAFGCTADGLSVAGTCGAADEDRSKQNLAADEYKYEKLAAFMKLTLNSLATDGTLDEERYPMPVEGRNSITESKVHRGQNNWEESDQLSRETLDHFDKRHKPTT